MEAYLKDESVPVDPKIAFPLLRRVRHFMMLDGTLFKRSYEMPLLRCLGPKEIEGILKEIHEGCYC